MKLKVRNGQIFEFGKVYENDNRICLWADYHNWGLGINFSLGDSRRFFTIDLLCVHLDVWC